ncbi:sensor domain-containing diguanylate cyclase [Caldalkalibacillus mannanilyticus]|uniref:sensor domain-containing diguanylate cyclase n=1 Tax=Caldalkalibacillus mannanilyticus TaxID=1418 RepID=UPI000A6CD629|nr:sensor domain-containing diguanylate cyclase [Caldalkalibacillus mannanilyticus]
MTIVHELGHIFTKAVDVETIFLKANQLVSRVMPTDAFLVALYKEGSDEVHIPFALDNGVRYHPGLLKYGEGNISKAIMTKAAVHIQTEKELTQSTPRRWGNRQCPTSTAIFVPMLLGDQVKGVISAQSYREFAYRPEHEELLRMIGFQVASAIETAELYDKIYRTTITDEMTKLKNYRAFHEDLKGWLSTLTPDQSLTLIMMDSDDLKRVNDKYGHDMGDQLIQKIADAIRDVQEREEAYRYAGDEFMILAPELSVEQAVEKLERIRNYLEEHVLITECGESVSITLSAGIAQYPLDASTGDELKRVVDYAMYQSKKGGKNCTTVYRSPTS